MTFENLTELIKGPIYEYENDTRRKLLLEALREVSGHHYENCAAYRKFCDKRGGNPSQVASLEDLPYFPTSIFKDTLLLSIPEEEVFREIQSSATTSGRPSRIGVDKANNVRMTLSLQRMLLERIGNRRFRTMVLDDESAIGRGGVVSARASMARSLLFTASEIDTCLNSDAGLLSLDQAKLEKFLESAGNGEGVMLFGFTFILYAHVVLPMLKAGLKFDMPEAKILHIGGWKKLESQKVTPEKLIDDCSACFGVKPENVIDIYGFSEQSGLLYPTCEHGFRHVPAWGEVICRDPLQLEPLPVGKEGLLQFLTPIQTSYPGHSILTEDVGYIAGHDDCKCGRKGTYFKVVGRSSTATEVRGCGDIMADKFA